MKEYKISNQTIAFNLSQKLIQNKYLKSTKKSSNKVEFKPLSINKQ